MKAGTGARHGNARHLSQRIGNVAHLLLLKLLTGDDGIYLAGLLRFDRRLADNDDRIECDQFLLLRLDPKPVQSRRPTTWQAPSDSALALLLRWSRSDPSGQHGCAAFLGSFRSSFGQPVSHAGLGAEDFGIRRIALYLGA